MSNDFPAVPSDLALQQVFYIVRSSYASANLPATSPVYFDGSAVQPMIITSGAGLGESVGIAQFQFQFTTPGEYGTFDQAAVEAAIAAHVTDLCQALADLLGIDLAMAQAAVTIARQWTWADEAGSNAFMQDFMTYPPA